MDKGFDIAMSINKNMMHQQNLHNFPITIVIPNSASSRCKELALFVPSMLRLMPFFCKHIAYILDK
jgi:hypothetical protein